MELNTIALIVVTIGFLLILSALFSGMETAMLSLSEVRLRARAESEEQLPRVLQGWLDDPLHVLTTLLIGNNAVNITASALATFLAAGHAGLGLPIAVGGMTLLVLFFGEIVPKSFAKYRPELYVKLLPLLSPFYRVCELLAPIMLWATRRVVRRIGGGDMDASGQATVTEEVIEEMVRVGEAEGSLDPQDVRLLTGVLELDDKVAREIMVPRTEVYALPVDASILDVVDAVRSRGFSRYPVYEEHIDQIIGVLYVKDMFTAMVGAEVGSEPVSLRALLRPPVVYPENLAVADLLVNMKRERVQIVIIASEYGGVAGIVSLEDVVEEVFGELYDEHDRAEQALQEVGERAWTVDGSVTLSDLEERVGVQLDDDEADYETVSGLLMAVARRVPEVGFTHEHLGVVFVVEESDATRLLAVSVTGPAPKDDPPDEGAADGEPGS